MEKITLSITVEDELYDKLCAEAASEGRTPEEHHMFLLRCAYPSFPERPPKDAPAQGE
ncbi:hypothetical protein LMG32289_02258 [Cupriavidus pampae]|uniref:CopG family transcriptional regulator n=1 Tax=Cupriavidus pampae TaxID=659251 RepID=A0ABM8WUF5_9BURK|nr:hypothetical protein LMG32289_02258 [Cupriavidus pampae]